MIMAIDSVPVTPSDSTDLDVSADGLRAEGAGDIAILTSTGVPRTLKFKAGETRFIRVSRVKATGTTATGIEAIVTGA